MLTVMTRAALALVALALAGCGSTSKPTPASAPTAVAATATATPGMTHTEFAEALNASCDKGNRKADALQQRFESAMERNALPEAGRAYKKILPLLQAHLDRVSVLTPPAADRPAMRRYLSAQHRLIGYGDRIAASLLDGDLEGVQLLVSSYRRERARRVTAAIDLGADKCGG